MDRDNAVYVQGRDERMRYGRVVDVAEDGLFIDLLCRNRRREYAPFGSVFFPDLTSSQDLVRLYTLQRSGVPLEVLVPETPSGPWIWHPGKIRYGGQYPDGGGAVVQWTSPDSGERCTDFVPVQRLRPVMDDVYTNAYSSQCVHPGTFIKRSVDLGRKYRLLSAEEAEALIKRLNSYDLFLLSPVYIADIVDGKLHYICQLSYNESLMSRTELSKSVNYFNKQLLKMVHDPPDTTTPAIEMIALPAECQPATSSKDVNSESGNRFYNKLLRSFRRPSVRKKPEVTDDGMTMPLPAELWQEVFSHLDTVTQTKVRAVCVLWSQILDAPDLRSTITVRDDYDKNGRFGHFPSLASIYKCLRPGTDRLAITHHLDGEWMSMDYAMMFADMMQFIAAHRRGIHLRSVYLQRVKLDFVLDSSVDHSLVAECALHQAVERAYYWLQNFTTKYRGWCCDTIHQDDCDAGLRVLYRSAAGI
ncbi:uncharacterized protein LOC129596464 isoform X4 [Paramacrobiotus metropolitanus]|uniref:uncharacterized protein LOC129596464 isoform X4 n=1 Tax=Paramacrobiotus metropolitanus TaxID=2943436 RepID=UPI0024460618|nr:uncharacterized protein LOC129596464 isoform X4 [Paramacrobiotus metropolitanus]